MSIQELIGYSRRLLKGRRLRTAIICILPAAASLFFRAAEACIYSLMLYFGEMKPIELFSGRSRAQLAIAVFLCIMRWSITAPLIYGAAFRLSEVSGESGKPFVRFSDVVLSRRCYRRSIAALFWIKLISAIALIPAVFFGMTAYSFFIGSHSTGEIFMTAHAAVLTVVSVIIWLLVRLSLSVVPLFLVKFPDAGVLRIVISSLRFMKGKRETLLKLLAVYLPLMMTVAAIPFVIPELLTACSLCIDIRIKEEEYHEGNKALGGFRKAAVSPKLPHGKGRVKTTADET